MTEKKNLRQEMIRRRDALTPGQRASLAEHFAEKLVALPQYREAKSVLATMSIGSEWSTQPFIDRARADGKTIVLPRVTKEKPRHLELHAVADPASDLVAGVWDIPEPNPERCPSVDFADVDFALVPALAVDARGYRLGYGAGYFDRLLANRGPRPYCVTAIASGFILERVPSEPHDVPVDRIVSAAPVSAP
jgi:5,10-methenyltetrahydrofolate synthetase